MSPEEIRSHWQKKVLAGMPDETEVEQYSRAVAARYAQYYLNYPDFYKWGGVAAYACHRIGLALQGYDLMVFDGTITKVGEDFAHPQGPEVLCNDLNHLRRTNNQFFADVSWALEAYVAPDGGIEAVRAGLNGLSNHEKLLEAFEKIERARALEKEPARAKQAQALIWEACVLIEYHGQIYSAQKFYESIDEKFEIFMSVGTLMNFNLGIIRIELSKFTWFFLFMWTLGLPRLIRTLALPDLRRLDHRWYWIEKRVMPIWRRIESKDPTVKRDLNAIVRMAPLHSRSAGAR